MDMDPRFFKWLFRMERKAWDAIVEVVRKSQRQAGPGGDVEVHRSRPGLGRLEILTHLEAHFRFCPLPESSLGAAAEGDDRKAHLGHVVHIV